MARMRDALKLAEPKSLPATPSLQMVWPEESEAEEVPFIEIGGPRVAVEKPATMPFPSVLPRPGVQPVLQPALWNVRFRELPATWPMPSAEHELAVELVCWHQPQHAISEQYRGLIASLQANAPRERAKVFLFTAAVPGAGTTTVLLNAAIALAQTGKRVLVLDAHLRHPAIAERLGLAPMPGLREVLGGVVPLDRALRPTAVGNLLALTAGLPSSAPAARLVGEAMRTLVRQLKDQFDAVLIDSPHWDGRPEVVALGCSCDAVYLCLPEKEQDSQEVGELLQLIPEQGAPLGGCIITSGEKAV